MLSKKQFYILACGSFLVLTLINDFILPRGYFITLGLITIICVLFGFLYHLAHKDKYITDKIIFIFFIIYSGSMLPFYFENIGIIGRLVYFVTLTIGLYFLLLSFNVFLVAEKINENLPLIQPSRLVVFLWSIISIFLFAIVNYKFQFFENLPYLNFSIKIILYIVYFHFLFSTIRWLFTDEKIGEFTQKNLLTIKSVSILSTMCMTQLAVSLMFFPFESYAVGMILAVTGYIFINIIQSLIRHRITIIYIFESLFLIVISMIFAYLIS